MGRFHSHAGALSSTLALMYRHERDTSLSLSIGQSNHPPERHAPSPINDDRTKCLWLPDDARRRRYKDTATCLRAEPGSRTRHTVPSLTVFSWLAPGPLSFGHVVDVLLVLVSQTKLGN